MLYICVKWVTRTQYSFRQNIHIYIYIKTWERGLRLWSKDSYGRFYYQRIKAGLLKICARMRWGGWEWQSLTGCKTDAVLILLFVLLWTKLECGNRVCTAYAFSALVTRIIYQHHKTTSTIITTTTTTKKINNRPFSSVYLSDVNNAVDWALKWSNDLSINMPSLTHKIHGKTGERILYSPKPKSETRVALAGNRAKSASTD